MTTSATFVVLNNAMKFYVATCAQHIWQTFDLVTPQVFPLSGTLLGLRPHKLVQKNLRSVVGEPTHAMLCHRVTLAAVSPYRLLCSEGSVRSARLLTAE